MDLGSWLADATGTLVTPFVHLLDQRSLFSYAGALVFVFVAALAIRFRRSGHEFRLRAFWRLLAKPSVWRHRSAMLDYKLYLLNLPLLGFVLGFFIVGNAFWSAVFGDLLAGAFGPAAASVEAGWALIAGIALLQLLVFDFGYWLGHAWMHRSEILWQFHKVHHSAEVMTPATEYRQHPVELILIPSVIGLVTGLSSALAGHWFGAEAARVGGYAFNAIAVVHMMTFHHLRHSHIDMRFTGAMGIIFHSPAHHRLHHSTDPAHFNCNMGYMLSIWDWAAGTLRMPRRGGQVALAIGVEGTAHDSVKDAMLTPFRDAYAVMTRGMPRLRSRRPRIEEVAGTAECVVPSE